jgi:hypothetical protein
MGKNKEEPKEKGKKQRSQSCVGIWPIKKRHDLCAWPLNIFLILKGG